VIHTITELRESKAYIFSFINNCADKRLSNSLDCGLIGGPCSFKVCIVTENHHPGILQIFSQLPGPVETVRACPAILGMPVKSMEKYIATKRCQRRMEAGLNNTYSTPFSPDTVSILSNSTVMPSREISGGLIEAGVVNTTDV
jgi:hypothetical protein